jgi:hypothetical protein
MSAIPDFHSELSKSSRVLLPSHVLLILFEQTGAIHRSAIQDKPLEHGTSLHVSRLITWISKVKCEFQVGDPLFFLVAFSPDFTITFFSAFLVSVSYPHNASGNIPIHSASSQPLHVAV